MKKCKKCLGTGSVFNGVKMVTCDICNGEGITDINYKPLEDEEFESPFGDD